jgi:putative addiction module killer protein
MTRIIATGVFTAWFEGLRDRTARQRVSIRLDRLRSRNPGDVKHVGQGISELRISHGPGYRLYCAWRGDDLVVLLCGGDKSTQRRDIEDAKSLLKTIGDVDG